MTRSCWPKAHVHIVHEDGTEVEHTYKMRKLDLRAVHKACRKLLGKSLGVTITADHVVWTFAHGRATVSGDVREVHGFRSINP